MRRDICIHLVGIFSLCYVCLMNTETHSFETWYVYSFHAEKEKKSFSFILLFIFFGSSGKMNEFLFKEECHLSFGDYFIFFHLLSCSLDGNIRRDEMRWRRKDKNLCLFHSHLHLVSIFFARFVHDSDLHQFRKADVWVLWLKDSIISYLSPRLQLSSSSSYITSSGLFHFFHSC